MIKRDSIALSPTVATNDLAHLSLADLTKCIGILYDRMMPIDEPAPIFLAQTFAITRELLSRLRQLESTIVEVTIELDKVDSELAQGRFLAEGRY